MWLHNLLPQEEAKRFSAFVVMIYVCSRIRNLLTGAKAEKKLSKREIIWARRAEKSEILTSSAFCLQPAPQCWISCYSWINLKVDRLKFYPSWGWDAIRYKHSLGLSLKLPQLVEKGRIETKKGKSERIIWTEASQGWAGQRFVSFLK